MPGKITCQKVSKKVGAWANVTKIIMGICFLLLFVLGMAMAIICGVSITDSKFLIDLPIKGVTTIMYMGLFLGLFLAIVALLGALGYFTLNRALLIIVTCLLILLAILQVTCGCLAVAYRDEYDHLFAEAWEIAPNDTRQYFEETYHCCGGVNETDLPASPECVSNYTYDEVLATNTSSSWGGPCVPKLVDLANDQIVNVGAGIIVVTILEIAVIVVTIVLVVKIGKARSYYEVHDDEDDLEVLRS